MYSDRVPKGILAAYSGIAFPLAAAFLVLQVIIPTLYAQVTSLDLTTVGLILLAARLWDTLTDPVVGYLSDKTPKHFGRRKIWMLVSAPFIGLSCWALFNPSADTGAWYLFGWTVAIYLFGTMMIVPMNAWGAELSSDYNERSRISGSRVAWGLSGTLCTLLLIAVLGGAAEPEVAVGATADANDSLRRTLEILTIIIVVLLVIMALIAYLFVPDDKDVNMPANALRSAFALLKKPSPFRRLLISFLINGVGSAIPATLFLLYVTHIMQVPGKIGQYLFIYFVFAALSVPLWVKLAKKWDKHQVWSFGMVMGCCFFITTPFLSSADTAIFMLVVIGTGIATGADLALPSAMNGDLIEWDALENGSKRPGIFFALWGTVTKLAYALAVGIAFPLLEWLGFSAGETNSAEALSSLAWMYGLPCIVCKLSAVALMYKYPITKNVHDEIRMNLSQTTTKKLNK